MIKSLGFALPKSLGQLLASKILYIPDLALLYLAKIHMMFSSKLDAFALEPIPTVQLMVIPAFVSIGGDACSPCENGGDARM